MRRIAELLGTLLAASLAPACPSSSGPPPPQTESLPLAAPAGAPAVQPAPAPPPRLAFQISVRYPATLTYALDSATAPRRPDERYRQWLLGSAAAAAPEWLTAYASKRPGWQAYRDDGDGYHDAYAACSHGAETIEALLSCAQPLVPAADLPVARAALEHADQLLRPHWVALEPALKQWQTEMHAITSGPQGTELAELLARSARLPQEKQLTFEVVVVAKPRSNSSKAHQAGAHLVIEVSAERTASGQAHIVFHELAHLAAWHAPQRPALERAFVGHGAAGIVGANLWNEAFATAFGNGLVAERIDPRFTAERNFYHDEAIDAVGRGLYRRWRAGTPVTLDASLADQLLQVLETSWPRERWRLADVASRLVVFGDDDDAGMLLRRRLGARELSLYVPVPPALDVPAQVSPPLTRLVLANLHTLRRRPDVLQRFGLKLASVRARVSKQGAGLYWQEDESGALALLTAATPQDLLAATDALLVARAAPTPGWTTLVPPRR